MRGTRSGAKNRSPLRDKTYAFARRTVKLARYLRRERGEAMLADRVLSAGTRIGACIEAVSGASPESDFMAGLSNACRSAREARYWVRLLRDDGVLDDSGAHSLLRDLDEIVRMLDGVRSTVLNRQRSRKTRRADDATLWPMRDVLAEIAGDEALRQW